MNCNHHVRIRDRQIEMGYLFRFAVIFSFAGGRRNGPKSLLQLQEHENDLKAALLEAAAADTVVPKGYLAVYVGPELRRFVIPTSYLSRPALRSLMERAEEEFGFEQTGGLRIPCDEDYFEQVIKALEEQAQAPPAKKTKRKKERSR